VTLTLDDLYVEDGFVDRTDDGDLVLYRDDEGSVYCAACATQCKEFIVDFDDEIIFADCESCAAVIVQRGGNITWLQT
jgi:NAD-dependent dihydropyrimidine dehydrogenase PreA subunit